MKTLRNRGDVYRGTDPETGADVRAWPGEVISVSEAKAAQLQADWPGRWEDLGSSSAQEIAATGAPNVLQGSGAEPEQLPKRKRGRPRKAVKQG